MINIRTWLASAAALTLFPASAAVVEPPAPEAAPSDDIVVVVHAAIGEFGVDLTARDTATKPGDDFERYASGKWIDATTIPSDRPSIGSFTNLRRMC